MRRFGSISFILLISLSSCLRSREDQSATRIPISGSPYCTTQRLSQPTAGTSGPGLIFKVDPMVASEQRTLSPGSNQLSQYTSSATLQNLTGFGILQGAYVDVVNGLCGESYGAFSPDNDFNYNYGDPRFSEVMDYYHGDRYRSELDQANALLPAQSVYIISKCDIQDNAYYSQGYDSANNVVDYVCMGSSSRYASADLSHDSQVVTHELQHAHTSHSYSPTIDFNQMIYDEAGAINEAVSDFVALAMTDEQTPNLMGFDPLEFSRWALGSFFTKSSMRGARRCPVYDSDYPACLSYQKGASGFSSANNHVSFSYPDGLGWPYAKTASAPGFLKNTFINNGGQQQIHQNAPIIAGTLWEIYEGIKANHSGSAQFARRKMMKLITEALAILPKPNPATDLSPVSFISFGEALNQVAAGVGFTLADRNLLQDVTDTRGLTSVEQLPAGWAQVGEGSTANAGLRFIDTEPTDGNRNERLNPGDKGAIFFDIKNFASITAGGLLIDVQIVGAGIRFFGAQNNRGYLSDTHAMIRYGKINGSAIVTALNTGSAAYRVPTGQTYFKTDPNYDYNGFTALWLEVLPDASPGMIEFHVRVQPTNGPEATLIFPAEIDP
jgi:hypothetical protein